MRGVTLPSGKKIILSDTVGFISDLPTQLVAAFRATLEEVLEADLILHVRDISHPESAEQAQDVAEILTSLGVKPSVPVYEVWNKLDLVDPAALTDALRSGKVSVAALDVFSPEPIPKDHPILGMGNVILAAHIASASVRAVRRLRETVAGIAALSIRGERLPNVVNGVQ